MSTYNPLVSIVIPVYKGANYMREAIDSALNQTYKNIEIIVVNDGSPDDGETERIALSYGDRVRYFYKPNGGCASALNYGISQMKGQWFSWLSHDDAYTYDKVEKEVNCIIEQRLDPQNTLVACPVKLIDAEGNEIPLVTDNSSAFYDNEQYLERLLFGRALNGCGLLIPKAVIDKTGMFRTDMKFLLDWEYWLRTALCGASLYKLGEPALVMNRVHGAQVTVSASDVHMKEREMVAEGLIAPFVERNSKQLLQSLYVFDHIYGCKKAKELCRRALRERGQYDLKLWLRMGIATCKKVLRSMLSNIYWMLVRAAKK